MDSTNNHIHTLIARSLTDQLDIQEQKEIEAWLSASEENLQEYNDILDLWTKSANLKLPSTINQELAFEHIRLRAKHSGRTKRLIRFSIQIAATLVLAVIFSGLFVYLKTGTTVATLPQITSNTVYQEVKSAYGIQSKIELPDGTLVYLNSGSTLRFPQSFDQFEQRKVSLNGEACFAVSKNERQPFIVEVNDLDIKVVGTTFNVEAYSDNPEVTIALLEGKVFLKREADKENDDLVALLPNQVATFNKSDNSLTKTNVSDLYKYTAWISGRIVFFNDPIETVVNKLGKWYNIDIQIADKDLENYRFTGTFIDESLEQILNILGLTSPMTYHIISSVKQADNSMSKRKIILKGKNSN